MDTDRAWSGSGAAIYCEDLFQEFAVGLQDIRAYSESRDH